MNIGVILNTTYHVETALSIYQSLKILNYNPELVIIHNGPNYYKLLDYLEEYKINYTLNWTNKRYEKIIYVSAFPTIEQQNVIPHFNHDIVKEHRKEDIILVSHTCNPPPNPYRTIFLTPICKKHNPNNLYINQCENPAIFNTTIDFDYPIRLLIQGTYERREIEEFNYLLNNITWPPNPIQFVCISNHDIKTHPSLLHFKFLTEKNFYEIASKCHFVLPLISKETSKGTYYYERFSSSIGLSFMLNRPMIIRKEINDIYQHPSLTYDTKEELLNTILSINKDKYQSLVSECRLFKEKLREHNQLTISYILQNRDT